MNTIRICCLLFILSCCNDKNSLVPWTNLSWKNPIETYIVIKNNMNKKQTIAINHFSKTTRKVKDVEYNLDAGQIDTFSIEIFRPELIDIRYSDSLRTIYLIPDRELELSVTEIVKCVGNNQTIYNTLLSIGDNQKSDTELEKIFTINKPPSWLINFIQRSKKIKRFNDIYHNANYQKFIGNDVVISKQDSIDVEVILENREEGIFHNYYSILQVAKYNYEFSKKNENGIDNEQYEKRRNLVDILLEIEEPHIRYNMIAMHTEGLLIRKRKPFKNKDKIYSYIIGELPEEYVLKLNEIEKEYSNQNYSNPEIKALLNEEITTVDGIEKPLSKERKSFKLLKFWFAGCAPCKKQIPYENKLLQENENLDILHFCKSTKPEVWLNYIDKNNSEGQHFYIEGKHLDKYVSTFNLSYSPRYILLDKNDEVVCWDCGNPSSIAYDELID